MITTTLLITLGKVAGGLTALYIFYTTVLKKWIKSAYARLMEDLSKQVGEINLRLHLMRAAQCGGEQIKMASQSI